MPTNDQKNTKYVIVFFLLILPAITTGIVLWIWAFENYGVSRQLAIPLGLVILLSIVLTPKILKEPNGWSKPAILVAGVAVYACIVAVDEFLLDLFQPNVYTLTLSFAPVIVYELYERKISGREP